MVIHRNFQGFGKSAVCANKVGDGFFIRPYKHRVAVWMTNSSTTWRTIKAGTTNKGARTLVRAVRPIKKECIMKKKQVFVYGLLAVMFALAFTACSGGGGGKSLNSATELKEYLDKQPANTPDQPIKVAMKVNDMMIKDIGEVIKNAGKYVSLDLSGSPLTGIYGFEDCETLVGITIPDSVTSIGSEAFKRCFNLTSITIPSSVTYIGSEAFRHCLSLTSITIPDSVTRLDFAVFWQWTDSQTINIQGKANREATIASGWHGGWDNYRSAQINYGK